MKVRQVEVDLCRLWIKEEKNRAQAINAEMRESGKTSPGGQTN